MLAEIHPVMADCARRANVEMRVAAIWSFGNERFDPGCIRLIKEAADRLGVRRREILARPATTRTTSRRSLPGR
jgi:hypothetical protein